MEYCGLLTIAIFQQLKQVRSLSMEISFKDISRIIKKNIALVLVIAMLFAVCSFFITKFFIQKTYTSSVKLYVSVNYEGSSGNDDLSIYTYTSKLVATYIEMLDTNKFYSAVSEELDKKYTPSQLKSMITFRSVDTTEIFKASVTSNSPTEAKEIADAVVATAPATISEILKNNSQLEIVDDPTVPTHPTSPNLMSNVLFAFFAGFAISLAIAFIRDYFYVKIKYDEEMMTLCDVAILGAIPDFEYFVDGAKKHLSDDNE